MMHTVPFKTFNHVCLKHQRVQILENVARIKSTIANKCLHVHGSESKSLLNISSNFRCFYNGLCNRYLLLHQEIMIHTPSLTTNDNKKNTYKFLFFMQSMLFSFYFKSGSTRR